MTASLSRVEIVSLFERILELQNDGKWEELDACIQPIVNINDSAQQRDTFIQGLRTGAGHGIEASRLESCVVDTDSQAIAARIIKTGSRLNAESGEEFSSKTFEYQEIALAWFANGRLSAFKTLQDDDARRARQPTAPTTPQHLIESPSTTMDLRALYHNYIASINAKAMDTEFHKFCQSKVTHNTRENTIAGYIKLISDSQAAINGLYFDVQDIIVDNHSGRIAARLEFTGLPVKKWADVEPNGESVRFYEHVMYWLDGGKITWVWSIVDLDSYREQLQSSI